ncbi:bacillithiol biosynthesis cysteine-adding enzyme BshC [Lewinella marina]|uniref:Putative cysteine ligase BshC n=1 Tax=Neolewinella marina TaxID=438751 RepID=A0A2G0CHT5_9BACT|nr:bacillithiol biosynthesis cysteine-adding enzyme BshC [Neolewinella marina]NJB85341.1 bacillithiol biosynthesis cysteine-adding enzyme BshC [Neolewinella marina]PHK99543.1 bacillithiol biosynthesis cysteine-adding enzyme BshC [Neolewinella marina]
MKVDRLPFSEVPQFSKRDVAYATGSEDLLPFQKYPVSLEAFAQVMEDKDRDATDRELLVDELTKQFADLPPHPAVTEALGHLRSRQTYTVITAHQPSLFFGPLYFVLKICSTINLARQLNARYPERKVVPVFISGGEDHDFPEVNHTHVYGNRISWDNEIGGPVADYPTDSLAPVLEQLREVLGDRDTAREIYQKIEQAYTTHGRYGTATLALVHELFGRYGLVVADMSRTAFKRAFQPYMERELFESVSQPLIEAAQQKLEKLGYSGQAHAREINLFYLTPHRRDRIVREGDTFRVLDTDLQFTADALRQELKEHPERFSPNVVMRPLFEELIFPNLAYIGGGGELAYWLERKEQFAAFGINFPMLIRRNSVLWIDKGNQKKLDKLELDYRELFREADLIIRDYVARQSENELSLAEELQELEQLFNRIAEKAAGIDPTLAKAVMGEHARQAKAVENLEGRLRRTEKQRFETAMNQIRGLRDKLFPRNGMQERYDSFLNFYLQEGDAFFEVLIEELNPLEEGLVVIQP